jgi:hypothetical protein
MNVSSLFKYLIALTAAAGVLSGCSSGTAGSSALPSAEVPATLLAGSTDCPSQGSAQSGPRPTEILNEFETLPTSERATDFEIVLCGNWVDQIGQQALWGPYDPFCPPSRGPSDPCIPTVTYDPNTNTTTVSFAGPTLYQNIPSHPGEYHFGLLSTYYGQNIDDMILAQYWTYASGPPIQQPIVSVNWLPKVRTCKDWKYATVFIAVGKKKGGAAVEGQWIEKAYCPKGTAQPVFTFQNFGTQNLYVVSSGGIFNQAPPNNQSCFTTDPTCPEDMAILATLNFAGLPPPGYGSSPFVKLAKPPPPTLKSLPFP